MKYLFSKTSSNNILLMQRDINDSLELIGTTINKKFEVACKREDIFHNIFLIAAPMISAVCVWLGWSTIIGNTLAVVLLIILLILWGTDLLVCTGFQIPSKDKITWKGSIYTPLTYARRNKFIETNEELKYSMGIIEKYSKIFDRLIYMTDISNKLESLLDYYDELDFNITYNGSNYYNVEVTGKTYKNSNIRIQESGSNFKATREEIGKIFKEGAVDFSWIDYELNNKVNSYNRAIEVIPNMAPMQYLVDKSSNDKVVVSTSKKDDVLCIEDKTLDNNIVD